MLGKFFAREARGALEVDAECGPERLAEVRAVEAAARETSKAHALAEAKHRSLLDDREMWKGRAAVPDRRAERERLLLAIAEGDSTAEGVLRELDAKAASDRLQADAAEAKGRFLDPKIEEATEELGRAAAACDRAATELAGASQHVADHATNKGLDERRKKLVATALWVETEKREMRAFVHRINRLGSWRPLPHFDENARRVANIDAEIAAALRALPEEPLPAAPKMEPGAPPRHVETVYGQPRGSGAGPVVSRDAAVRDLA